MTVSNKNYIFFSKLIRFTKLADKTVFLRQVRQGRPYQVFVQIDEYDNQFVKVYDCDQNVVIRISCKKDVSLSFIDSDELEIIFNSCIKRMAEEEEQRMKHLKESHGRNVNILLHKPKAEPGRNSKYPTWCGHRRPSLGDPGTRLTAGLPTLV